MVTDTVVEDNSTDTRTHKITKALDQACHEFDLSTPIWLNNNISDFQRASKTRFRSDNFIEEVEFDYLEISVIEEDFIF